MPDAPAGGAVIRPARPDDRAALYAVCLATGCDGEDAAATFRDPDLLGHRYVGPYLDLEPDLAFTLEDAHGPCGYALGAADSVDFYRRLSTIGCRRCDRGSAPRRHRSTPGPRTSTCSPSCTPPRSCCRATRPHAPPTSTSTCSRAPRARATVAA